MGTMALRGSVLATLLTIATPTWAAPVVIDFDTLPGGGSIADGTVITDQYDSLGVTFSAFENGVLSAGGPVATTDFAPGGQDGNRLGNFIGDPMNPISGASRADVLRIDFASLVDNVSFDFFPQGSQGGNTLVEAFDGMGGLLFSGTTGISGFPVIANYVLPVNGVSRIDITQPTDSWNWGLDDLTFEESSAVPEPTSLCLLAIGGFGLAIRRRRQVRPSSAVQH